MKVVRRKCLYTSFPAGVVERQARVYISFHEHMDAELNALRGRHVYEDHTPSNPYQLIFKDTQTQSLGILQLQHRVFTGMDLFENLFSAFVIY